MNEIMNPQVPPMNGGQDNPFGQDASGINLGSENAAPNPFLTGSTSIPAVQPSYDAPQQSMQFEQQVNPQQMAQFAPQANHEQQAQFMPQQSIPQQSSVPSQMPTQYQAAPVQSSAQPPAQMSMEGAAAPSSAASGSESQNPIAAAMGIQMPEVEVSIYAKLPVFVHGSANEEIEDITQTFEDLRVLKADDFPELEDANRVSWEVNYGKVRKLLTLKDAKATKIGELKSAIETSKEFTDGLKKSKEKAPVCTIKPKVSAQSKGERMSGYKGIFTTVEEAQAAGKVISFVPGRDGKVYEIRQEEAGTFTMPVEVCEELSEVKAGFVPALPRIPSALLMEVVTFFRAMMFTKSGSYEAIANIYWDRECEQFSVHVPKQTVSSTRAVSDLGLLDEPDGDRYLHYMDIHSHNVMAAKFSSIDDMDEKATRLYAVIGYLDSYMPEINVRMSCGGRHHPLNPNEVFEPLWSHYPKSWDDQLTFAASHKVSALEDLFLGAAA